MTIRELLETPIGAIVMASMHNQPELAMGTPAIASKLRSFAEENGYSFEAIVCAVVNILMVGCNDAPHKEIEALLKDQAIDPTVN